TSARARREIGDVWGVVPDGHPGLDTAGMIAALGDGTLAAAVTGAVDLADLPDPLAAARALAGSFVVILEQRPSAITEFADVIFPVAAVAEKAGTFVNWEGRPRSFSAALPAPQRRSLPLSDHRVLNVLAAELGADLGCDSPESIHREFARIGPWTGPRAEPVEPVEPGDTGARAETTPPRFVLASWRMLLDDGSLQDGEPHLAGTARRPVVRLSPSAAARLGAVEGDLITVATEHGSITLPLAITDMLPGVVWVPMNSPGSHLYPALAALPGDVVTVRGAS
ncbi:MAG: molybdopterin dinucleotide binding domain-containing protein, partial [Gordonia sp. (in: high G+C Gram-positive bacteria)]|uniref:molybdopterin dinucleotide binding domain-containing protein n=1 Tax=Gordonia sp. (in: high G+C Gram-positive bacteria) TaxID=84139 RepID=UPI003BB7EDF2